MELNKNEVIERIKEAKNYGLNYSRIAREIGLQPVSLYMFVNGTYNMAKEKQLKALCFAEEYIKTTKEQLKMICNLTNTNLLY